MGELETGLCLFLVSILMYLKGEYFAGLYEQISEVLKEV